LLKRPFTQRSASPAHGLGHARIAFAYTRGQQKFSRAAQISWRVTVKENGRILRETVGGSLLGQKAMNGQVITQDAHAAFCGLTTCGKRLGRRVAFGDGGEEFQFNGSLQCLSLLIGL
jgi:hypothetical protein